MVFSLKPALESFDIGLQFLTKLRQRPDLLIRLRQVLAQDGEDLLFGLDSAWIAEIEVNHVPNFVQAKAQVFQLLDLPQAENRFLGVVMLAVTFTLTRRK